MATLPTITTTALLEALASGEDPSAWERLDERYRPILFHLARRMGLGEEDAADAAQETLLEFFRDYRNGRYERERGRLRHWILAIARNRIRDVGQKRHRMAPGHGSTWLDELPGTSDLEQAWQAEVEEEVLRRAYAVLARSGGFEATTLRVFEDYVLREQAPELVARAHGISVSTVYAVKSRCLLRLRELRAQLAQEYEESG